MSIKIWSAALNGLDATLVAVEADSGGGDFGQITIVGLPDAAVSESKERVKSALRNCGLQFPRRRITINLAPANLRKHGPAYDLPIAISILSLKNKFSSDLPNSLIIGELSLNGEVRSVNGILSMVIAAKQANIKNVFIPQENEVEARLITGLNIFPVSNLIQLINHFKKNKLIIPNIINIPNQTCESFSYDLSDVRGQEKAKRALEIAATGGHNLLFFGSPGSGKTLLARTIPSILPKLSLAEKLEITKIYSVAGELNKNSSLISTRPFRSPHHSASGAALIGGGSWPRPGEISLAHRGVLFLDEFPEFARHTLENLRQPIEEGFVNISRASGSLKFPSKFTLIAAMNPCPCGYYGDKEKTCHCGEKQINSYRQRLSGPILDRIDMHIEVQRTPINKLKEKNTGEKSAVVRTRVEGAREIQNSRFKNYPFSTNSEMNHAAIEKYCQLNTSCFLLLKMASEKMHFSTRSYFRILKLARTIADLENRNDISENHLAEAIQYRSKIER